MYYICYIYYILPFCRSTRAHTHTHTCIYIYSYIYIYVIYIRYLLYVLYMLYILYITLLQEHARKLEDMMNEQTQDRDELLDSKARAEEKV
jgi:hypothetical protein